MAPFAIRDERAPFAEQVPSDNSSWQTMSSLVLMGAVCVCGALYVSPAAANGQMAYNMPTVRTVATKAPGAVQFPSQVRQPMQPAAAMPYEVVNQADDDFSYQPGAYPTNVPAATATTGPSFNLVALGTLLMGTAALVAKFFTRSAPAPAPLPPMDMNVAMAAWTGKPEKSAPKVDILAQLKERIGDQKQVAELMSAASGIAVFMLMLPEAAQAATDMMTPEFFNGVADAATQAIGDANSVVDTAQLPSQTSLDLLNAVSAVGKQTAEQAQQLAVLAAAEGADKPGLFGSLVNLVEGGIISIKDSLTAAGIPESAGLSITLFTLLIKALTFPLNKAQIESTSKMQLIQPTIKKLQDDNKENPQEANIEIARLYKKYDINPLAALLPAFAQIPIFIALYRALVNIGKEDLMDQPFLWIPSLQGPVFDLQQGHTTEWLTQGGMAPAELACYLSFPVILVVSQTLATQLQKTPGQETPGWINYLPLMTGAFALNVPSGLSLYWIVNNIITTATTVGMKQYFKGTEGMKMIQADIEAAKKSQGAAAFAGSGPGTLGGSGVSTRRERRAAAREAAKSPVVEVDATVVDVPETTKDGVSASIGQSPVDAAEPAVGKPKKKSSGKKGKKGKKGR